MVRIITTQSIFDYAKKNPKSAKSLTAWVALVRSCTWKNPQDIVDAFGTKAVDLLGKKPDGKPTTKASNRVVIDVKGNHIRIIAKYQFHSMQKDAWLFIAWIGSHKEYDEINKKNLQYEINIYK